MIKPRYQKIPTEQIPTAQTNKNAARVQVLAGEALGASATIKTQPFENQLSATVYLY